MKIAFTDYAQSGVLAGALAGQQVFRQLVEATSSAEPPSPTLVALDFAGIDVATASFLRESILSYRDFVRGRRSTWYPVVLNANELIQDELKELLKHRGDVLMAGSTDRAGHIVELTPIGVLDPKQQVTFELVTERGETDARELWEHGDDDIKQTAWNNRLSSLAALGLVFEIRHGRSKRYKALSGTG